MLEALIRVNTPRPRAKLRLYCLPHAGGGASFYREWGALTAEQIEVAVVQYPGREERITHPPAESLAALAADIATSIARFGVPAALFGHSMGAILAHRVAQALDGEVAALLVSACPSPDLPRTTRHHLLPDEELAELVRRHQGTSPEVLADPSLRELVLGVLREDYRLIETHVAEPAAPLGAPVTAFWARTDPSVAQADMRGWADVTRGRFDLVPFDGGHFYLVEQRTRLLAEITERLRDVC